MIDGLTVAKLRHGRHWTIRKLADIAGVNYTALSRIERGHRHGTWVQAVALAKALDVPVLDILVDPDDDTEPVARTTHGNAKDEVA